MPAWKEDYLKLKWNQMVEQHRLQTAAAQKKVEEDLPKYLAKTKQAKKEKGKKEGGAEEEPTEAAAEASTRERPQMEPPTPLFPLITPDDQSNNRKSLYRKLDQRLYLIVKNSHEKTWNFPQVAHDYEHDGLALKKTAHRGALVECGPKLDVFVVGNGPMGFWNYGNKSYLYNPSNNDKFDLTKVFYYKGLYIYGTVKLNRKSGLEDYLWVTVDELKDFVDPKQYEYIRELVIS